MKRLLAAGVVVLATAAMAWAGVDSTSAPKVGVASKPVITKALKGEQCVEDTDYMRRNHMDLLNHHRDETVIKGVRTKQHSLKECINCHASEKSGSVAKAKDDFCVSCHSYAAVKIDCFECHSTKPQGSMAMHPLNAETAHYAHKMATHSKDKISAEDMAGISQ